jgi:alkaline phosphatase
VKEKSMNTTRQLKVLLPILVIAVLAISAVTLYLGQPATTKDPDHPDDTPQPTNDTPASVHPTSNYTLPDVNITVQNIILMIGDGMGTAHINATRNHLQPDGSLALDTLNRTAMVETHSSNTLVTDSAAAATAFATGAKTNNGMISLSPSRDTLETILEVTQRHGKATGLVTTTSITHATPAAFAAHVPSRYQQDSIAVQLLEHRVDVLLGGGREDFKSESRADDRDLIQEAIHAGYTYLESRAQLLAETQSQMLLGLFAQDHLAYSLDRPMSQPTLAEMTGTALAILSRDPDGFFLMVEGGRIDHAGHANNLENIIAETIDFDDAVSRAAAFVDENEDSILVVTADHETGGLELTPDGPKFTTGGHTDTMVPLCANGRGAYLFTGTLDNTQVGGILMALAAPNNED